MTTEHATHATPLSPPAGETDASESADWRVAVLLAVAAVLAALLGARAALLVDDASDAWQTALRQELKRSVATITDVRYVYGPEGDQAFMLATQEVLGETLRSHADAVEATDPVLAAALDAEARVHEVVASNVAPTLEVAGERYRLPEGGFDLVLRLADIREDSPDLLAIDPDVPQQEGDEAAGRARLVVGAAMPIGVAFLAGALAMPFRRRRRLLLAAGWLAIGVAGAVALAAEVATLGAFP